LLRSVVASNPARRLLDGPDKPGTQEKDRHHCNRPSAERTNNPSQIRLHKLLECEPWLAKARVAGADQQLTASSCNRLARRETEVINRSVQTKNRPIAGAVSRAVAIPITRQSAPDFDAIKK